MAAWVSVGSFFTLSRAVITSVKKPCIAFSLVTLFRYPLNTALTIAVGLAQIGEFSYILAGLGLQLGLLAPAGLNLILAGSLISIGVNPLLTRALQPLHDWLRSHSRLAGVFERPSDPLAILPVTFTSDELTGHVVLVGYGRVGRRIGRALLARGQRFVVIESSRSTVEDLRAGGLPAVAGDAADPEVLIQGHIVRASMLIIAMPDAARSCRILEIARMLNPGVRTIARAHSDEEAELLVRERVGGVFYGEQELANAMIKDFEAQFAELMTAPPH